MTLNEQRYLRDLLESNIQQDLIVEITLSDLFKKNSSTVENIDDTEKMLGVMYGLSYMLLKEATLSKGDFFQYLKKSVKTNFQEYEILKAKWAKVDGKSVEDLKHLGAKGLKALGLNLLIPGYSLFKAAGKKLMTPRVKEIEDATNYRSQSRLINEVFFDDEYDDDDFLMSLQKPQKSIKPKTKSASLIKKSDIINPRLFKAPYTAVIFHKQEPSNIVEAMEAVTEQLSLVFKTYVVSGKKIPQLYSHFNGFKYFNAESLTVDLRKLHKFINATSKPTFNTGKIDTVSVIISNYLKISLNKEYNRLTSEFDELAASINQEDTDVPQEEKTE
jgi:hypothetical protein